MARRNQILGWVQSASNPLKNYEVALEIDASGAPMVWLTGPGAGMPRVHCDCPSMINRKGVDNRGNCKHVRAVLDYTAKDSRHNSRSSGLHVHDAAAIMMVRNWQRKTA